MNDSGGAAIEAAHGANRIASGIARMPATCGELVQGTLGGVHFHVSCPVDLYSKATVELTGDGEIDWPEDSPKSGAALRAALRFFRAERLGARLRLDSPVPRGKGMGSSTADIAATIWACADALGARIDPAKVARLALDVEPTDGSVFPGVVLFDHRRGGIYEALGGPPRLSIAILDFGGQVDTLAFNSVDRRSLLRSLEPQVAEALRLVRQGLAESRLDLIGEGATLSALANQKVLEKPDLPMVQGFAREIGALGVNVAHSGTVIGVLLDPNQHDAAEVLERARRQLPGLEMAVTCRLVSGGKAL